MIQQHAQAGNFDGLVSEYDRYRIGYSTELYDAVERLGIAPRSTIIDIGCGTGLATEPFVARGIRVVGLDPSAEMLAVAKARVPAATFVTAAAEHIPYGVASFDGAVSAQAFHWFDADRAYAELLRVVKPGGTIAVWWKVLGSDDPLRAMRAAACEHVGVAVGADPLRGGFGAFYRAPFARRTLRVLPFTARFRVDDWIGYERSRATARNAYGDKREAYIAALSAALTARYGSGDAWLDVRYTQYLYAGTAP